MKITRKHLFWILYSCLFLSILTGFLVHSYFHTHIYFFWETLPVFSAVYGFIGCIVIIVGSKAIGHYWLQKKEDYYEKYEGRQSEGK